MWSNLNNVVGAAIQTVQKLQSDLETQMDQAVGLDNNNDATSSSDSKVKETAAVDSNPVQVQVATMDRDDEGEIKKSTKNSSKSQKKKKADNTNISTASPLIDEKVNSNEESKIETNEIVEELKKKHIETIENLKKDYDSKINDLKSQVSELESKDLKYSEDIKKLKEKHTTEKNNLLSELNKSNENRLTEIENLKKIYDEKIQSLSVNTTNEDNNNNSIDESTSVVLVDNSSKYIEEITQLNISLENQTRNINQLELQLKERDNDISNLNDTINLKNEENLSLNNTIIKLKEIITDRERALETSTINFSELNKSNEDLLIRLNDLNLEISQKDIIIKQHQTQSVEDMEMKKQLIKTQETLKEKQSQLALYEQEGQNLSKKQGEMEKTVRKTKSELKEKDNEIQKLKESKEQLMKALQEVQELLKKQETEVNNTSKNYNAMQAVSQATSDKLSKLETELNTKSDELSSQKRALENAWAESNELKRLVAELKADRDDLRRQIGLGTSKVMETESSRRDVEQREAVLRATSKQLQDSLQRQMQEASAREQRLREEVGEMRQRWQEAVASREAMSSDLTSASAPLLRQISSLQESLRLKTESWQTVESSLSERALRAENTAELAEHKRSLLEEQFLSVKQQHSVNSAKLQECQSLILQHENEISRLKRVESQWVESKIELESRLSLEVAQRQNLQNSLREFEMRQKVELQNSSESQSILITQRDLEISKLKRDLELLQDENKSKNKNYKSNKKSNNNDGLSLFSDNNNNESIGLMPGSLANGDISFAATEKLHQKSRQKDEEVKSLNLQIQQLQQSRNALLEEVSFLSMRNSELEEQMSTMPKLIEDVNSSHKRIDLLLILLGEKEEELDAAMSDMREIKSMYRSHMEDLMGKIDVNNGKDNNSNPVMDTN